MGGEARLPGGRSRCPAAGRDLTSAVVSYFKGPREEWKTGLPTYGSVVYEDLWPGIDLVFTGAEGVLKATYVVKPGADPGLIRLAYRGPEDVAVTDQGRLRISTPLGGFEEDKPYSYQETGGKRVEVATAFALQAAADGRRVCLWLPAGSLRPVEDALPGPGGHFYCGYIGGSGDDYGNGIAVDGSGNAYVAGYTASTEATFPETGGPDLTHNGGTYDAFVAKVNAAGTALTYCGYIGGTGDDYGMGSPWTARGTPMSRATRTRPQSTFPVTVGPDLTHNGGLRCLRGQGERRRHGPHLLRLHRRLGRRLRLRDCRGRLRERLRHRLHRFDRGSSFPVTGGPDLTHNGGYDAFVAKVNAAGTALTYCGYIGGTGD